MKTKRIGAGAVLSALDLVGKLVLIVVMAFPFFWMISTALQTLQETIRITPTYLKWCPSPSILKTR